MTEDVLKFVADRLQEDDHVLKDLIPYLESLPLYWISAESFDRAWYGIESGLAIAREHQDNDEGKCSVCADNVDGRLVPRDYPCLTLRSLTWVYSSHPDYDDDWSEGRQDPR